MTTTLLLALLAPTDVPPADPTAGRVQRAAHLLVRTGDLTTLFLPGYDEDDVKKVWEAGRPAQPRLGFTTGDAERLARQHPGHRVTAVSWNPFRTIWVVVLQRD